MSMNNKHKQASWWLSMAKTGIIERILLSINIHSINCWNLSVNLIENRIYLLCSLPDDDVSNVALSLISVNTTTRKANEMSFRPRPVRELIGEPCKMKRSQNGAVNSRSKSGSNDDNNHLDAENSGKRVSFKVSMLRQVNLWNVPSERKINRMRERKWTEYFWRKIREQRKMYGFWIETSTSLAVY